MKNSLPYLGLYLSLSTISQSLTALEPTEAKPNIIFIFADDLGWGDLSCYGNNRIKTPSLDKLAKEGTLFTSFYVAASVCSPSRAGIMSGQYPARNKIYGHLATEMINETRGMPNALNPNLSMITDMLKKNGYTTAHFGKWHLGNISPIQYGVDVFRTDNSSNIEEEGPIKIWSPESRPTCTKDILHESFEFIKSQKDKPFYANIWFSDVHATLNPSKEQMDRVTRESAGNKPLPGIEYSGAEQVYLAALLEMDKQVGIFLDKLDSLGISKNTLVIFSSDNGPEDIHINNARHSGMGLTGPFRGRKRSIYEGGIRVPFILRCPGTIPAGKINNISVISGVDFMPTIAAITGTQTPSGQLMDGEDMSDVWLGADRKRKNTLYWEWRYSIYNHPFNKSPMIAIRERDFKLLVNPDGSRAELYNIVKDPGELMNLAVQEADLTIKLSGKAITWFKQLPASPWDPDAGQNQWNWPK